jgi:hypothetical protein
MDQLVGLRLGFRREIAADIELAHGFAHRAADKVDAPLPPVLELRRSGENLAVEGEAFLDERARKQPRGRGDGAEGEIVFPGVERLRLDELARADQGAGIGDDDPVLARESRRTQIGGPIEAGYLGSELGLDLGL